MPRFDIFAVVEPKILEIGEFSLSRIEEEIEKAALEAGRPAYPKGECANLAVQIREDMVVARARKVFGDEFVAAVREFNYRCSKSFGTYPWWEMDDSGKLKCVFHRVSQEKYEENYLDRNGL